MQAGQILFTSGAEAMQGEIDAPDLSLENRELTRQKLVLYLRKNGIGVPKLRKRILAGLPGNKVLPLSNLQHFLSGIVINDTHAAMIIRFAADLPAPDPDPLDAFGRAMAEYHESLNSHRYAGEYLVVLYYRKSYKSDEPVLRMSITRNGEYCRVTEEAKYPLTRIHDGVLVSCGEGALMFLKDRMTQARKHYVIEFANDDYHGFGMINLFSSTLPSRSGRLNVDFVSLGIIRR